MALQLNPEVQVAAVVAEYPVTKKMFEAFGIDYCCGGRRMLMEAAAEANVSIETLLSVLATTIEMAARTPAVERDWQQAPLGELIEHIVAVHHGYLNRELSRLSLMLQKVTRAHGEQYGPMLQSLSETFASLRADLESHLAKEEEVSFPAIQRLVDGGCDADVRHAVSELEHEHTVAGGALARMRDITGNYALPENACATYAGLYEGLQELERDLHQHIHLENNILFPRVVALVVACEKAA